ncbi:MAG: hypothetical protein L0206_19425, partial [Actinobacteria bacterium]|nr:hypothetical protein [Actinomycetota bacterium]
PLARVLDGRARLPGPIRFAATGAPTPASQRMIDQLAHFLIKLHPTTIRLVSHGTDAAEGATRAESVRQLLLQRGVPAASAGTVAHEAAAGATNVTVE